MLLTNCFWFSYSIFPCHEKLYSQASEESDKQILSAVLMVLNLNSFLSSWASIQKYLTEYCWIEVGIFH